MYFRKQQVAQLSPQGACVSFGQK